MTAAVPRLVRATGVVALLAMSLLAGCAGPGQDPGDGDTPTTSPPTVEPTITAPPATTAPPTTTAVPADLTITLDETGSGTPREMTLTCVPTGGDHPDPDAACATLATAGTTAFAPPPRDEMCTEQYGGPQVATVVGTVDGTAVRALFSRTNGCEIGRWDRLAPLLGSTGGV